VAGRLRRGGITLELILCLPVWLIVLAATVEFGLFMTRLQQVALAARVGAMEASHTEQLDEFTDFPVDVEDVVNRQLQSAKRESAKIAYCRLILEHNVGISGTSPLYQDGTDPCDCDPISPADIPLPECGDYVRVTVCVRMSELTPNLLKIFGFDISQKIVQHTATYRYESTELGSGGSCNCSP
jgi:hypothetical protein